MNSKKFFIIASLLIGIVTIIIFNSKNKTTYKKELTFDKTNKVYTENLIECIQSKIDEDTRSQKIVKKKGKEISEFKKSEEYQKREQINLLEKKYNIKIKDIVPVTWEVSFYSDLISENSECGPVNCIGDKLADGMIANNHLNIGQKVEIEGLGIKTVSDRGSNEYFYKPYAVDVFVPRKSGEKDYDYLKRVNNLGRQHIKGYILIEE